MFNVEQNIKLFQQGSYQEQIQTIEKLAVSSDTSELDDFQSLLLYVRENEDYTLILNMYRVFAERADQINMETSK